jgi:hypothetical protein
MAVQTAAQLNQQSSPEGYLTTYRQNLHDTLFDLTYSTSMYANCPMTVIYTGSATITITLTGVIGTNGLYAYVFFTIPAGSSITGGQCPLITASVNPQWYNRVNWASMGPNTTNKTYFVTGTTTTYGTAVSYTGISQNLSFLWSCDGLFLQCNSPLTNIPSALNYLTILPLHI